METVGIYVPGSSPTSRGSQVSALQPIERLVAFRWHEATQNYI